METLAQRCARITAALEDLVMQESVALRTRDFATADTIADRAAPLVEWLVACSHAIPAALKERIAAVQARRAENLELLAAETVSGMEELRQIAMSRRRVAQVMPAYRAKTVAAAKRLSAVG
jgi:hypothetical protein